MQEHYTCVIVDDDQLILMGFEAFIEQIPWLTLLGTYSNPVKAASGIFEHRPDFVLLDVEMPYMDGYELLEWISFKLDELDPRPQIMIVTSSPERLEEPCPQPVLCRIFKPTITSVEALENAIKLGIANLTSSS